MRIVNFPASIAVLLLAALLFHANFIQFCGSAISSQMESSNSKESNSNQEGSVEEEQSSIHGSTPVRHRSVDHAERLLSIHGGECCPSEENQTSPVGGLNKEGQLVILYKDGEKAQSFYEVSCKPEVLNKTCRFVEEKWKTKHRSRCVQKYSYSYALVVPQNGPSSEIGSSKQISPTFPNQSDKTFVLDHIKIRSGCSCEVTPYKARKSKKKKEV